MSVREEFVAGARTIGGLLRSPALAARWEEDSALDGFRNGALAGHLVRAVTATVGFLEQPVPEGEPEDMVAFFVWATSGWAAQADAIVDRGEQQAAGGPQALNATYEEALARLEQELAGSAADRRAVRNNRILTLDDLLIIRALELIVHADDLAVSLEVDTPAFGADLTRRVIDLLVATAVARHGDLAVLRSLTRSERDTAEALRVV